MIPNQTLTDALDAVRTSVPGNQRRVRIKRATRAALAVDAERDALADEALRLHAKLDRQWDWLCRNSETEPEYGKRERLFYKTLHRYERCCDDHHILCDQLTEAGKVLLG